MAFECAAVLLAVPAFEQVTTAIPEGPQVSVDWKEILGHAQGTGVSGQYMMIDFYGAMASVAKERHGTRQMFCTEDGAELHFPNISSRKS